METPSCMPSVLPSACSTLAPNSALSFFKSAASLAVQWLRLCLPTQGVCIPSLVGELRSHMPRGQKKQNTQKNRSNIATNSMKTLKMAHSRGKKIF